MRYFIIYFICIGIPTFTLSSVISVSARRNMTNEICSDYNSSFEMSCGNIDTAFSNLQNAALTLGKTRWVTDILAMQDNTINDRLSPFNRLDTFNNVKNLHMMLPEVDCLAVVFPKQDAVFSDAWVDTVEKFFTIDQQTEGMSLSDWNTLLAQKNNMTVLPLSEVERLGRKTCSYITLVQSLTPLGGWADGAVLYCITEEHFGEIFGKLYDENCALTVYDAGGNEIFSSNRELTSPIFSFAAALPFSGWTVECGVPDNVISRQMSVIFVYTVWMFVFLVPAVFALAYVLAARNYKPIREMLTTIDPEDNRLDGHIDEISMVKEHLNGMDKNLSIYRSRIEEYGKMARAHCVRTILRLFSGASDIPETDIAKNLSALGLRFEHPLFRVVFLLDTEYESGLEDAVSGISDEMSTVLSAKVSSFIILVCNYADAAAFEDMRNRLNAMIAETQPENELCVIVSTEKNSLAECAEGYYEALTKYEKEIMNASKRPSGWLFAEKDDTEGYRIPYDISEEEQIVSLLKIGDSETAAKNAEAVLCRGVTASPRTITYLYHMLIILPFRVLDEDVLGDSVNELSEYCNAKTVDQMRECIRLLYGRVCEKQLARLHSFDDELAGWIVDFAEQNLQNPDLCLKLLSDEFALSVSQISRLFKKSNGDGFSKWLDEKRISKACELLKDSRMNNIAEISRECGYTNDASFRRAFKRQKGVTPAEYRDTAGAL